MSSINAVMQMTYLHHKSCVRNFLHNELDDSIYWKYIPFFTAMAIKQDWANDNCSQIKGTNSSKTMYKISSKSTE